MDRIRPKLNNKLEIPVNIYRGEKLIAECASIQEAARFFKDETKAQRFNWSAINKGIWDNVSHSINGNTYYFITAEEAIKNKLR